MQNVTFISAGAGSGKTYSLCRQIVEFVKADTCSADQIILTTFTRAAAAELRERVRSALYGEGLYEEAVRIDNAAIGTIHSIAYQLVSRYWYLLGISADVRMIDEDDQKFYVRQSLAELPTDEDLYLFREMLQAFNIMARKDNIPRSNPDFWQFDLCAVIDKVNDYCIDDEGVERAIALSKQTVAQVLHTQPIEIRLEEVLQNAERVRQASLTKKSAKKQAEIEQFIEQFQESFRKTDATTLNVSAYIQLAKGFTKECTGELAQLCPEEQSFFANLPDEILSDHRTCELIASYIDTIFRLARKWQTQYNQFKKDRRILDFNDVQRYFAQLLDLPDVAEEIRSRYKVALVDEFQDCSPQQIRFFDRLSELMLRSVWVGDLKQAIYNFRGTDTALVKAVIDEVGRAQNGNTLQTLPYNWRSSRPIVSFANTLFSKVFENTLPRELITLDLPEHVADYRKPKERAMQHWHLQVEKADERYDALAYRIKQLHETEQIAYRDIAVLCRYNDNAGKYAAAFDRCGIPCRVSDGKTGTTQTVVDFLTALVSVAANSGNNFSQALVAYYTEPGYTASKILSDRLRFLDAEDDGKWLSEVGMIRKITRLIPTIGNQSVSAAVETLVVELNAADCIKRMDPKIDAYDYCQLLIQAARRYEEQCTNLGIGCSLMGFADFVKQQGLVQSGDETGVTVSTYHKSKGLEWKCVILSSLDIEPVEMKKVFFGVNVARLQQKPSLLLIPEGLAGYCTKSMAERMEGMEIYRSLAHAAFEESKRLMYVGMTRPKELLVTTSAIARGKRTTEYGTTWLDRISGSKMPSMPCGSDCFDWFDHPFRVENVKYVAADAVPAAVVKEPSVEVLKLSADSPQYPLRDLQPSRIPASDRLQSVELAGTFAARLHARTTDADDAALGNCIHQLMCIWRDDADFADTVTRLADAYGVQLDAERFIHAVHTFYAWLKTTYGEPLSIDREVPFQFVRDNGQVVHGEIDLLYRTAEGDVLIDYKTYSGAIGNLTNPDNEFYAGKYSGQIATYEEALQRVGRVVRDRLICYFSLGTIVRMRYHADVAE